MLPKQDFTGELNIERKWNDGRVRLTLFKERTNNAIISQTNLVTNPNTGAQTPTTTISNVDAIRMQGVELSGEKDNVLIHGLQLFGSVTYVDSRILSDPSWAGTNPLTGLPTTVVGKRVPYVPDWRAKFGFTYRPNESWAYTVAARYSGKQYSTLDNTDIISACLRRLRQLLRGRHESALQRDARISRSISASIICSTSNTSCSIRSRAAPIVLAAKYTF